MDAIYFGARRVSLRHVPGRAVDATNLVFELSPKSAPRHQPIIFANDPSRRLVLTDVPSLDVIAGSSSTDFSSSFPGALIEPLIKCESGPLTAIVSGARSAIIMLGDQWYRLKGSGNFTNGFETRRVENAKIDADEIRGCMFEHTCLRELEFLRRVNALLQSRSLPVANIPLGWWEYEVRMDEHFPSVPRLCGISQTFGEKRLGDHLLVGLERSLAFLYAQKDIEGITHSFSEARIDPDTAQPHPSWVAVLMELPPIDGRQLKLSHTLNPPALDTSNPLSDQIKQSYTYLLEYLMRRPSEPILANLFYKLGSEVGTVFKLIQDASISWGTFEDLLGFHCNAHPNNFIVLPEGKHSSSILAPLDFDLAYDRKVFEGEPHLLEEWTTLESNGMQAALAGDEAVNSGASGTAELEGNWSALRWALRDTLMLGFRAALAGGKPPDVPEDTLRAYYALVTIALSATMDDIA